MASLHTSYQHHARSGGGRYTWLPKDHAPVPNPTPRVAPRPAPGFRAPPTSTPPRSDSLVPAAPVLEFALSASGASVGGAPRLPVPGAAPTRPGSPFKAVSTASSAGIPRSRSLIAYLLYGS